MIGQKLLLNEINNLIERKIFPRFCIINGEVGSGRNTLCKYIAERLNYEILYFNNNIDDIRNFIEISEEQNRRIIYILKNAEEMSNLAKNSLLKIIEEPPKNCIIILITSNKNILLPTIRSRGIIFDMLPYAKTELLEYINNNLKINNVEKLLEIVNNIGEIDIAFKTDLEGLNQTIDNIFSNIVRATWNALFRLNNKLKLTENDEGFDLNLFFNYLNLKLVDLSKKELDIDKLNKYLNLSKNILIFKRMLIYKNTNKKYIMDKFLIELKETMS